MQRNLRQILILAQAMLVMALSVQASRDVPHHYTPPAVIAEATAHPNAAEGAAQDVAKPQHDHETTVDHAMIQPDAAPALPPLAVGTGARTNSIDPPTSHRVAIPDRPPRRSPSA